MTDAYAKSGRFTRFRMQVVAPKPAPKGLSILGDAGVNAKIGGEMVKGRFAGMKVYTVTFEERKTCWTGCKALEICYGDNMWRARRIDTSDPQAVFDGLSSDCVRLERTTARAGRAGFLVRLHVLGDFFSLDYVAHWRALLERHPLLHLYGYTHWPHGSPIGDAVAALAGAYPERTSFLRSDGDRPGDPLAKAITVAHDGAAAPGTVVCPAQTGRTDSCATCGLCMNGRTSVSFRDHGHKAVQLKRRLKAQGV